MKYSITRESSGFIAVFNGVIRAQDIHETNVVFHGDEDFEGLKYSIWDFNNADLSNIELEEMLVFVAEDFGATFTLSIHKLAIIVTDPHGMKLMSYYIENSENCGSSWKFGIFNSMDDAKNWVNEDS